MVIIVHGWPQPITEKDLIYRYFSQKGYHVCCSYLYKMKGKLSLEKIKRELAELSKGAVPNVIVGVSIGGLLVPHLALDYPEAKLVFVSSGAHLSPKNWFVRYGPGLCRVGLVKLARFLNKKLLLKIYKLINPNKVKRRSVGQSGDELFDNLEKVLELPDSRIREIADFVSKIDNSDLLTKIKNKTVIFSGDKDSVMPYKQGKKMSRLIKNSRFFVLKGKHNDLVDEEMLKNLDGFLED